LGDFNWASNLRCSSVKGNQHKHLPLWQNHAKIDSGKSEKRGIAQLVERQLCKLEVRGSNPIASISKEMEAEIRTQFDWWRSAQG
jgi:hypothetical protein